MGFIDHQQGNPETAQELEELLMLHPFRRQIEQLKLFLMEILDHPVFLRACEARVKCRSLNSSLFQAGHLILHQGDQRRNDQGQPWQDGRRQLVTQGFPLSCRHNRHRVAPCQHGSNDLFLTRPKGRKAEPFTKLCR